MWNNVRETGCDIKFFYDVEMSERFDNMGVCNMKNLTEALKSIFEQEWKEKMLDKVKLHSYKQFRLFLGREKNLKINVDHSEILYCSIKTWYFTTAYKNLGVGAALERQQKKEYANSVIKIM